jgi:N-acetylmuramoyl-L-alanine amidase
VFDLKQPLKGNDFVLSPNELYGHRLVIDLRDPNLPKSHGTNIGLSINDKADTSSGSKESSSDVNIPIDKERIGGSNQAAPNPKVVLQARPNQHKEDKLLIAIDAGHGGEDPGASGHSGSREKNITLAIAQRLKWIVDQDPRMDSYMVRRGDYYIKLHKRRLLAREAGADLFISIHADAFRKKSASGFSVFALSQSGATSAMAGALAAKENASDLIGGVSLADKDEVLAKVLVDLSMTNTISESVNFGGRILKELGKIGKLHSRRVEQAGFAVLKSADIPSVLVETGFVTNPTEEKNLTSSRYQSRVAEGIHRAINEYFQQTPYKSNASYANPKQVASNYTSLVRPGQSKKRVKTTNTKKYHKVVRGDSLSKIAVKYGTSIRQLKSLNNLRGNTVMRGQRLKLPVTSVAKSVTRPSSYVVKRGDSLSRISLRFNVTIGSLKAANSLRKDQVYIGQKLTIPGGGKAVASRSPLRKPVTHTVKRGDTLSEIAERYGSSARQIRALNSLRSSTVMLGQKLKIPQ